MIRSISCQSFAGGFDLGAEQAGLHMIHKVEQKGGFGLRNVQGNRHLFRHSNWTSQACEPHDWEPMPAEVLIGNPPCSGFSPLSVKTFRGPTSPINSCMWRFQEYAAKIQPYVAVFESVQQAFSGGRELMQALRDKLEWDTGFKWDLYHIKHNAASVGGSSIRRRYFWLVSRIPFGVEEYPLRAVPRLLDVIGDLTDTPQTWLPQPYRQPRSWWVREQQMESESGVVDGHIGRTTPYLSRALDLLNTDPEMEWGPRENVAQVAKRYYEKHGTLPPSWKATEQKVVESDFHMGYNQLVRWKADGMARVATGAALDLTMHPTVERSLTHREVARIMGFPDDWLINPLRRISGLHMTWGKGITVQCGRWIGEWIRRSIEGRPGTHVGETIGDREFLIDHTNTYRRFTNES